MPEFDNYRQRFFGAENVSLGRPGMPSAVVGLGTFDETDGRTYVGLRVRGGVLLMGSREVDDLVRDLRELQTIADRLNGDDVDPSGEEGLTDSPHQDAETRS